MHSEASGRPSYSKLQTFNFGFGLQGDDNRMILFAL